MSNLHLFIFGGLIISVTLVLLGIGMYLFNRPIKVESVLNSKPAIYRNIHTNTFIKVISYGLTTVYVSDSTGCHNISYETLEKNYTFETFIN